jgi:hypothetical protein
MSNKRRYIGVVVALAVLAATGAAAYTQAGTVITTDPNARLPVALSVRVPGMDHGVQILDRPRDRVLSMAVGQGIDIVGYARLPEGRHGMVLAGVIQPGGLDYRKDEYAHGATFFGASVREGDFIGSLPCDANAYVFRSGGRTQMIVDGCGDVWRPVPAGASASVLAAAGGQPFYDESELVRSLAARLDALERKIVGRRAQ